MEKIDIKILAQKIAKLESELRLGKNIQDNQKKIEDIMATLSLEEGLAVDNFIFKNNLLTK